MLNYLAMENIPDAGQGSGRRVCPAASVLPRDGRVVVRKMIAKTGQPKSSPQREVAVACDAEGKNQRRSPA